MKKLLMIIPLVFLLCFTFGCQQAEEVAEESVETNQNADEAAIREKRQKEREAREKKRAAGGEKEIAMTPAAEQADPLDQMLDRLNRIHRRVA